MLESFATRTIVPLLLRFALAAVFIYHGLGKVSSDSGFGFDWDKPPPQKTNEPPPKPHEPISKPLQAVVAWGELACGIAIALGILTRLAALGIAVIMVGAILTVHGAKGFGLHEGGYEYNFVLILVALCLMLTGAGTFSLDSVIRVKMRGPAKY